MTADYVCGVEQSLTGQPWRWRRAGGDELGRDLTDQLLLARGIDEADLARHRAPTIRDFTVPSFIPMRAAISGWASPS